jgi:HD-GYP domain-containing protein (c-di-GMP phosphodiesterase class II)
MEDLEPPDFERYLDRLDVSDKNRISVRGYMGLLRAHTPKHYAHSLRVMEMCVRLGDFIFNNGIDITVNTKQLFYAGLLHDVGKLRVRREILEGAWKPEYMEEMKPHALEGFKILTGDRGDLDLRCSGLKDHDFSGLAGCLLHHEYQGDFYPKHLPDLKKDFSAGTISLAMDCSKLVALADAYDAGVNRNGRISHEAGMDRLMERAESRERDLLRMIELLDDRGVFIKVEENVLVE